MDGNSVQIDMGRVVQRTASASGEVVANLTAELGMAREVIAAQQERIGQLENALAEKDKPEAPPVPA